MGLCKGVGYIARNLEQSLGAQSSSNGQAAEEKGLGLWNIKVEFGQAPCKLEGGEKARETHGPYSIARCGGGRTWDVLTSRKRIILDAGMWLSW